MPTITCPNCGTPRDASEAQCPVCVARSQGTTVPVYLSPDRHDFEDLKGVRKELEQALAPGIEILRPLGRGGMGAVFLARDRALKRQVVIKVLSPEMARDKTAAQRFAREAEAAASVWDPNVVGLLQVGQLPRSGTSYFVMQYVSGPTLAQACPIGIKMLQARCRRIVGEIASGLAAAHARGLVHRDIKPSNVILEGPTERAVVLDFGISAAAGPERASGERLTATGTSIGTPAYMSPEQAAGQDVTDKSDVYSLGVVAFELLTGRSPFREPTALGLLAAHMKEIAPKIGALRPDLDPDFAELVDRMLAKHPRERPTAAEVARALLPGAQVVEWPPPGLERLRGRGTVGLRWLVAAVATVAVYFLSLALRTGDLWWILINTAAALVGIVAVVTAGVALGMTGRYIRWARRAGYPFRVAIDAALDGYSDTAALLNGTGRFASLPGGTGWRWLGRRRRAAAAILAGTSLTGVLVGFWAAGVLHFASAGATSLVGLADAAVIFAPTLAATALATILRLPETGIRSLLRPLEDMRLRERRRMPRDLVSGWLASVGLQPASPMHDWRGRVALQLVDLAPAGILLLAIFGLAGSLMSAVFLPGKIDRRGTLERDRWESAVRGLQARAGRWRAVDALVARTARVAPVKREVTAARALIAFPDTTGLDPGLVWSAFRSLPGHLRDSVRAALATAADPRALELWRRVAASVRLPALWYATPDAVASDSLDQLGRQLATVPHLALNHAGAAALALEHGDRGAAVARAREILALGRLLWNDPLPATYLHGVSVLEVGTRALAAVATVTQDRSLAREADTLRATLDARRAGAALFSRATLSRQAASPLDTLLTAITGDPGLAPVDRWAIITGIAEGACWNSAEIRSGVSPLRFYALSRAADRAADIAHTGDWAAKQRHTLEQLQTAGPLHLERAPWAFAWLKPVRRSAWCAGVRAG